MKQTNWLFISLAALIGCVVLIYSAARSEIAGKAIYHAEGPPLSRYWFRTAEPVTRADSPAKFRTAANGKWVRSLACAVVSIGSFVLYRKTEYLDD